MEYIIKQEINPPDNRLGLNVLNTAYKGCLRCDLGRVRSDNNEITMLTEGESGGLLVIGSSPSKQDIINQRFFSDENGQFLRETLKRLKLHTISFMTTVACRSFDQQRDNSGELRFTTDKRTGIKRPVYQPCKPHKDAIEACRERVLHSIYYIDPVMILIVDSDVYSALKIDSKATKKTFAQARGSITDLYIPGAGFHFNAAKSGKYFRGSKNNPDLPVEQNWVRYPVFVNYSPETVLANQRDQREHSPTKMFFKNMSRMVTLYNDLYRKRYNI